MKCVFLMDPIDSIHPEKDTTLMLMHECFKRGHNVYYVGVQGLSRDTNGVVFHATDLSIDLTQSMPISTGSEQTLLGDDIDVVFVRWDPPFDGQYYYNTLLLDFLPDSVLVLNKPSGLRQLHEKVWVTQFSEFTPPTLLSSNKRLLKKFLQDHQKVVAKPLHQFGGQSIFICEHTDVNATVILETLSANFCSAIILQSYVDEATQGDKRILLLNGEPLGAVLRVHSKDDHRNNLFAGGTAEKTTITDHDEVIINHLRPYLNELGLYFVGIDIIGDQLIEVNVTSPTCLQEINRLNGVHLEKTILDFVESRCKSDV